MTLASLHTREFESAFSFHKQSAIGTALAAADIDKKLPYRGFGPPTVEFPAAISDDGWYGRGTNFPTFWDPIQKRVVIPPRQYSMTNYAAMFAAGFVMGAVSSTQPNSAGYSSVYDHAFTFQDAETNMDCNYTSLMEKAGAAWQNLISGVVLEQFTIEGNPNDHVSIRWQGFGRTQAADATALPALTTTGGFFNFRRCTLAFGATGATAAVGDKLTAFNFTANQNPNARRNAGASAGEEMLISRVVVGKQRVTGGFTLDQIDSDLRNLFLNNSECAITLVCIGDLIAGTPYYHQVTISIPHFYIPSEAFGEDTDLTTITLPFNEQTVIKSGADAYCTVTVRTNIDDSEILELAA
jgi:hypothetical protein